MKSVLLWLTARLPCRLIADRGLVFLERYFVARIFGATIYVHRFVASDPDRGLHDHPWDWSFSLMLSGWYYEQLRNRMRRVRWFNWLSGDRFHRVVLPVESYPLRDHLGNVLKIVRSPKPQECWTLFVHGRKAKPWGFLRQAWDRGDRPGEVHGYTYVVHRDQDNSDDSDAWARSAPKGREVRT